MSCRQVTESMKGNRFVTLSDRNNIYFVSLVSLIISPGLYLVCVPSLLLAPSVSGLMLFAYLRCFS